MNNVRMKQSVFVALLLAALWYPGAPARAQDRDAEIDKIFSWATPTSPGCAVAVAQNGTVVVERAYGMADLEREVPISANSVFDAGSLLKQFVAAAALLLVDEGKISLSEDVRQYLPELPDYGHKITVDHLLTHTSGIRDWTALMPLTPGKEDALTMILRQRGLNFRPGEEWGYSNSGFVLAREVVARMSGMTFGEFTRKRLFEPLGMKATSFRSDMRHIVKHRAVAYDKDDFGWRMAMLLDEDRGGGGILSTAGDLIIWNEALTNDRLGSLVSRKLQEPARLNNGRVLGYARGLFPGMYRGTSEVWHTGSADGYKSYLGRFPDHGLSIAIMCNSGDGTDRTAFAHSIFDLFVPDTGHKPVDGEGPPPPVPADMDVSGKAGLYVSTQGEALQLAMDRGRFRVAGGPGLVPLTADHFRRWGARVEFMSGDAFELQFHSQAEFDLKSMEGSTTRYRRAQPYAPTADDLKKFAGRYENNEIGTVVSIEQQGEGLALRMEHLPTRSLAFKPIHTDTFQFSRMTVRFRRDENGRVVAFAYSNPLLRDVEFVRLSDREGATAE